jgi:hypothetical protein
MRKQPNPLTRLNRPLIDPTTAVITILFALIVAAPVGILMGLVFGGIGS